MYRSFQHFAVTALILLIIWLFITICIFIYSLRYVKDMYTNGIIRFTNNGFPPDYHAALDHAIHITSVLSKLTGFAELLIFILSLLL